MKHSSADSQRDSVDAKADKQDNADILAAIRLMKADLSVQLHEVASSNQAIKEAIEVFSERLTAAESRIDKAEDDIVNWQRKIPSKEGSIAYIKT